MNGILYLCATPIGNLEDMTFRAVRILSEVDLIAAEDTRNSIKLLNHFGIRTPMTSYHEHNKYEKAEELIGLLLDGKSIAVITDAGMPGISDPGEVICRQAHEKGITVTVLPGACAAVNALVCSGMPTDHFVFEGFLPRDSKSRKKRLSLLAEEERTMILYEAPHRLKKTLEDLHNTFGGERDLTVCRELTKIHEDVQKGTIESMEAVYAEKEPKGEFVLIIKGRSEEETAKEHKEKWSVLTLEEHMRLYTDQGLDEKEAMKKVASDLGLCKRDIYNRLKR